MGLIRVTPLDRVTYLSLSLTQSQSQSQNLSRTLLMHLMNSQELHMHEFKNTSSQIWGHDLMALRKGRYRVPGQQLKSFKRMTFFLANQLLQMNSLVTTYSGRVVARRRLRCHLRSPMATSRWRVRLISVIPAQWLQQPQTLTQSLSQILFSNRHHPKHSLPIIHHQERQS